MLDPKVIVALDYDDQSKALNFVDSIDPKQCRLKIGKEMFTLYGPELVKKLHQKGFSVFLDLKFHDIPNTCAKAVKAAAELGVWMTNVHASGGERMMTAAREIIEPYGKERPLLIAVTVLTSMEQSDLVDIGIDVEPKQQVKRLARLTQQSGLDGVVCSAHESKSLKNSLGTSFKLITPGIRPEGSEQGDQRRIMSPSQAIQAGSDYIVIGRPITKAKDPNQMLMDINQSLCQFIQ